MSPTIEDHASDDHVYPHADGDLKQLEHKAHGMNRLGRRFLGANLAVLVVAIAAVLLVVFVVALGSVGRTAVDRTRAQTAADAAALASVETGRPAAESIARRHGASVVTWSRGPGTHEVTVTVRLGDTTATARATNAP